MILMTLLISSIGESRERKSESDKSEKEKLEEYERCCRQYPCKNDDVAREKLTDHEKTILTACRLHRLLKCSTPEEDR